MRQLATHDIFSLLAESAAERHHAGLYVVRFCCLQEEEGDILEIETRGLEVIGKAFKPPGGG